VVIDTLCAMADEVGATPAPVALAWVRSHQGVASTIIGARRLDQLEANLAALDLNLIDAQVAKLNAVSKPAQNFPSEINTHLAPPVGCFPPSSGEASGSRTQGRNFTCGWNSGCAGCCWSCSCCCCNICCPCSCWFCNCSGC
jgi:hypothetical protein